MSAHPSDFFPSLTHSGESPSSGFIGRLFFILLLLLIASNILVWGSSAGLGVGLFILSTGGAYAALFRQLLPCRHIKIFLALLALCGMQFAHLPGWEGFFCVFTLWLILSGSACAPDGTGFYPSLMRGLMNLLHAPLRWGSTIKTLHAICPHRLNSLFSGRQGIHFVSQVFLPAIVVCGIFGALLLSANAILAHFYSQALQETLRLLAQIEFPSLGRILFSLFVLTISLGLLWPRLSSFSAAMSDSSISRPVADQSVFDRLRACLILLGVNLLFLTANTIDGVYLWFNQTVPTGISHSQFVHHGAYNLIVTVILAGVFLSYLSANGCLEKPSWIRALGLLWIFQNLFLVISVGLRVHLYILAYDWTVLRFYLISFLVIVFTGFLLLAAQIVRRRNLEWLISRNLAAVFGMIFCLQFVNVPGFVAWQNVKAAQSDENHRPLSRNIDFDYLTSLGPAAIPALISLARNQPRHLPDVTAAIKIISSQNPISNWQSFNCQHFLDLKEGEKFLNPHLPPPRNQDL